MTSGDVEAVADDEKSGEAGGEAKASGEAKAGEGKTFIERFWLPIILASIPVLGTVIVAMKPWQKSSGQEKTTPTATTPETKRILALGIEEHVRDDPHGSTNIIATLPAGTQLEVLGEVPDGYPPGKDTAADKKTWFYVSFADPMAPDKKLTGWVSSIGVVMR